MKEESRYKEGCDQIIKEKKCNREMKPPCHTIHGSRLVEFGFLMSRGYKIHTRLIGCKMQSVRDPLLHLSYSYAIEFSVNYSFDISHLSWHKLIDAIMRRLITKRKYQSRDAYTNDTWFRSTFEKKIFLVGKVWKFQSLTKVYIVGWL